MSLDSLTFTRERHSSSLRHSGDNITKVDIGMIQSLPKILGNTDPISFIRNLPGVQTGAEYDSGIHICGSDNAHNDISIEGVPVYGATHLFGFFSAFNPTHYTEMEFSTSAEQSNRLGGSLRMNLPDTLSNNLNGDVAVGIMSAQGTLGVKLGNKSHLRVSARSSFMNLLYKRWLQIEGSPIRYGFSDYNLTYLYTPTSKDKVWVDAYYGYDSAQIREKSFDVGIGLDWGNYAGSIHWEHKGKNISHRHTAFASGRWSSGEMYQNISKITLVSHINTFGYKGKAQWRGLNWGAEALFHDIQPQLPQVSGLLSTQQQHTNEAQQGVEASIFAGYNRTFADRWNIGANLRGNIFLSPEGNIHKHAAPNISLSYNAFHYGKASLSYGWQQQYLFNTGLSNLGLPTEFWFMASDISEPQQSQYINASYMVSLFKESIAVKVNLYSKILYNQVEYYGDFFDFFNSSYSLEDHLLHGKGFNYGINFIIHKQTGNPTGWISYSYGRALRRFNNPDFSGIYPANHERIHELNAVCTYKYDKWDFSGTFVFASGAPFTAPEAFYLSSGQIITKFGEHNACRMRPYIRLDLSASYCIKKDKRMENGVNFSIYNVLARDNDLMYRVQIKPDGRYYFDRMCFFLQLVPSISYYHKF